jgi:tyrosyl-DNA phosphodiesterase 2
MELKTNLTQTSTTPMSNNTISRLLGRYKNRDSHGATLLRAPNSSQSSNETDLTPKYQNWHEFNPSTQKWICVDGTSSRHSSPTSQATDNNINLVLATWNIDAGEALPQPRTSAILSHLSYLTPSPDIIFLQEVSRPSLELLLGDERFRESWFSSEMDSKNWGGYSFATMTLLSKARFSGRARIGPVWRVNFRSKFGRDALCCDIFLPNPGLASGQGEGEKRVRLVNVHLDSLAVVPSCRPHQLATVASSLRSADRGVVAGDFNPVLPEDKTLVEENGLVDAWQELRKGEDGFTWGIDGKAAYPPNRMDKVALLGLVVRDIEVMDPGTVVEPGGEDAGQGGGRLLPWSDHSGLRCTFGLA